MFHVSKLTPSLYSQVRREKHAIKHKAEAHFFLSSHFKNVSILKYVFEDKIKNIFECA